MRIEIKRSEWLRGEGPGRLQLVRNSDRKMCCFGFRCLALGIDERDLIGKNEPGYVWDLIRDLTTRDWTVSNCYTSQEATEAMAINDDPKIDELERERQIASIFALNGDEIIFAD